MTEITAGGPRDEGGQPRRKVLDLSAVQVAASTLAAVVAAGLTSLLGVHGTIIGAAVVSTSATTGAAVFQHVFKRTGERVRGSALMAAGPRTPAGERARRRADARAAFAALRPAGGSAAGGTGATAAGSTGATGMAAMAGAASRASAADAAADPPDGTGRKTRGWKAYALTTGLIFLLAMGTVTAIELIAGKPVAAVIRDEPGKGTSVGGGSTGTPSPSASPTPSPSTSTAVTPGTGGAVTPDATATTTRPQSSAPESVPTAPASTAAPSAGVANSAAASAG